jgi:CheY-like chemotaxis protein
MLAELGCAVVGPAHALDDALKLARTELGLDVAVLDVNLGGQPVFAVADALREKGVPAIFSTGYGDAGLREIDRGSQVLQKPFRAGDLAKALNAALGTG